MTHVVNISNIDYALIEFKYFHKRIKDNEIFFFLENFPPPIKKYFIGKAYILIPSWVEMQDLYQSSSELNIMNQKYEIEPEKLRNNKLSRLCSKLVSHENETFLVDSDFIYDLDPQLGHFLLRKIDEVINEFYSGSSLSEEEEKELANRCYKYYSAINKRGYGKNVKVPPPPGVVLLMDICKKFNCTPDVARKISRKDIDMMQISQEQENLCAHPGMIGLGSDLKGKRN